MSSQIVFPFSDVPETRTTIINPESPFNRYATPAAVTSRAQPTPALPAGVFHSVARRYSGPASSTDGFTLTEMVVVVSIILVLAALLMPALQKSVDSSRRVQCVSNLRQLSESIRLYASDSGNRIPLQPHGRPASPPTWVCPRLLRISPPCPSSGARPDGPPAPGPPPPAIRRPTTIIAIQTRFTRPPPTRPPAPTPTISVPLPYRFSIILLKRSSFPVGGFFYGAAIGRLRPAIPTRPAGPLPTWMATSYSRPARPITNMALPP